MLSFLVAWASAPFTITAGIGACFALLHLSGLLGVLAGGGDAADQDVDHGGDQDPVHDVEHDGHEDEGVAHGWSGALLAPLGVGRLPISLVGQLYAFVFAATGLLLNARYLGSAPPPPLSLAWTLPSSLAAGYAAVALVARVLGPVLSSREHEATSRAELVGQIGVVISSRVDPAFGEVRIRDKSGHDLRVVCKLHKGARPARERESVVVVEYDSERGEIFVEPLESDLDADR